MLCWLSLISLFIGGDRHGVTCLAAHGNVLAAGGHGGLELFSLGPDERGEGEALAAAPLRASPGEKHNTFALAFAGELLIDAGGIAGERGAVRAWNWKSRELVWKIEEEGDIVYSLAVSADTVFAGGGESRIALLDRESGRHRGSLSGHAGPVLALALSPDGKRLASGGADRSLRLWDASSDKPLRAIHNHSGALHALAWSPDGKYLASGSADRSVRLWEPLDGRLVRIIRDHDATVLVLAFAEGRLVSGASDGKVRFIDPASAAVERVVDAHKDWVTGIAVTRGGIFSADWSGRILRWPDRAAQPVEVDGLK